jgi:hypothetical protein
VNGNADKQSYGPAITINHPPNGADVTFASDPLSTPADGTVGSTAVSMAYQVDGGLPAAFTFNPTSGQWAIPKLLESDCPTTNTWYTLTVYAWDKNGAMGWQQSTFRRV